MKGKLLWHQIILFVVLALLSLERLLLGRAGLNLLMVWWWIGGVTGFLSVFSDRLIHLAMNGAGGSIQTRFLGAIKNGSWFRELEGLVNEREEQKELVMRSVLFAVVWVVLSIFVMSSSVNMFARGLMVGIGVHLMFDMVTDFVWDKQRFNLWFWQIKRDIPIQEKKWFLIFFVVVGAWLMWNL